VLNIFYSIPIMHNLTLFFFLFFFFCIFASKIYLFSRSFVIQKNNYIMLQHAKFCENECKNITSFDMVLLNFAISMNLKFKDEI
jgi:hypothetical protein